MIKWHLEDIPLKDLKDHPKNPRQIHKEQLQHLENLIDKFGLIDKPIVNVDHIIIGGHQRIRILKKQKVKIVECWVPDRQLTEEEIDHLCIGLNLNQGAWDYDLLANMWEPIKLLEWGFSEEQLLGISEELEKSANLNEEEDALDVGKDEDAKTKNKDIYQLGDHYLICGDSCDPEIVRMILEGKEVVLMVTDPPYGVNYDPVWRKDIKDKQGVAARALGKVSNDDRVDWSIAYSLFTGSVVYVWHGGKHSAEVAKNLENCDYEIISQIIWKKQHFVLSRGDYHWQHEPCWYAVKKGHQHNWKGDRKQTTIWEISNLNAYGKNQEKDDERTCHSTQKPIECMGKPIQNHTDKGDWVYDPFLGSGTTLIAAEKSERKCVGIELSPAYCDVIVKRYINYCERNGKDALIKKNGSALSSKDFV